MIHLQDKNNLRIYNLRVNKELHIFGLQAVRKPKRLFNLCSKVAQQYTGPIRLQSHKTLEDNNNQTIKFGMQPCSFIVHKIITLNVLGQCFVTIRPAPLYRAGNLLVSYLICCPFVV